MTASMALWLGQWILVTSSKTLSPSIYHNLEHFSNLPRFNCHDTINIQPQSIGTKLRWWYGRKNNSSHQHLSPFPTTSNPWCIKAPTEADHSSKQVVVLSLFLSRQLQLLQMHYLTCRSTVLEVTPKGNVFLFPTITGFFFSFFFIHELPKVLSNAGREFKLISPTKTS